MEYLRGFLLLVVVCLTLSENAQGERCFCYAEMFLGSGIVDLPLAVTPANITCRLVLNITRVDQIHLNVPQTNFRGNCTKNGTSCLVSYTKCTNSSLPSLVEFNIDGRLPLSMNYCASNCTGGCQGNAVTNLACTGNFPAFPNTTTAMTSTSATTGTLAGVTNATVATATSYMVTEGSGMVSTTKIATTTPISEERVSGATLSVGIIVAIVIAILIVCVVIIVAAIFGRRRYKERYEVERSRKRQMGPQSRATENNGNARANGATNQQGSNGVAAHDNEWSSEGTVETGNHAGAYDSVNKTSSQAPKVTSM